MIISCWEYRGYKISQAYRESTLAGPDHNLRVVPGTAIVGKVQVNGPGIGCLELFTKKEVESHIDYIIKFKMNRPKYEMYGDRGKPCPKYYGLTKKKYDETYG